MPKTTENPLTEISHASGSFVWTTDGRRLTDLMTGFGAVFLGHGHPAVTKRLQEQAGKIWQCGRVATPAGAEADARIRDILPTGLKPGGLYSTGMEAAEFAMRLAAHRTGRAEFAGFARSMHGKSALTAALCWDNAPIRVGQTHALPFVDRAAEGDVLAQVSRLLETRRVAALLVEPIQGTNGGHEASPAFYERLIALCRETGTCCLFDEILTGLYRTGSAFYVDRLAARPDILLFAKSMGNGFPASSLAIPEDMAIPPQALPGSTFSGNPLAAAVVAATLAALRELPIADQVGGIERTVREALGGREAEGLTLRGRGAMWLLELGPEVRVEQAQSAILSEGVLVSCLGRCIRLLPAATIEPETLRDACDRIKRACADARS